MAVQKPRMQWTMYLADCNLELACGPKKVARILGGANLPKDLSVLWMKELVVAAAVTKDPRYTSTVNETERIEW